MDTQTVPYQPVVLLRAGGQLSGGVLKLFFFFYPFLKPLKIAFIFRFKSPYLKRGVMCARVARAYLTLFGHISFLAYSNFRTIDE